MLSKDQKDSKENDKNDHLEMTIEDFRAMSLEEQEVQTNKKHLQALLQYKRNPFLPRRQTILGETLKDNDDMKEEQEEGKEKMEYDTLALFPSDDDLHRIPHRQLIAEPISKDTIIANQKKLEEAGESVRCPGCPCRLYVPGLKLPPPIPLFRSEHRGYGITLISEHLSDILLGHFHSFPCVIRYCKIYHYGEHRVMNYLIEEINKILRVDAELLQYHVPVETLACIHPASCGYTEKEWLTLNFIDERVKDYVIVNSPFKDPSTAFMNTPTFTRLTGGVGGVVQPSTRIPPAPIGSTIVHKVAANGGIPTVIQSAQPPVMIVPTNPGNGQQAAYGQLASTGLSQLYQKEQLINTIQNQAQRDPLLMASAVDLDARLRKAKQPSTKLDVYLPPRSKTSVGRDISDSSRDSHEMSSSSSSSSSLSALSSSSTSRISSLSSISSPIQSVSSLVGESKTSSSSSSSSSSSLSSSSSSSSSDPESKSSLKSFSSSSSSSPSIKTTKKKSQSSSISSSTKKVSSKKKTQSLSSSSTTSTSSSSKQKRKPKMIQPNKKKPTTKTKKKERIKVKIEDDNGHDTSSSADESNVEEEQESTDNDDDDEAVMNTDSD